MAGCSVFVSSLSLRPSQITAWGRSSRAKSGGTYSLLAHRRLPSGFPARMRRRAAAQTKDAGVALQGTSKESDRAVQELTEFLKGDLPHLFDEQGIDKTKYEHKVDFKDPITKYGSIEGYLFNIQFLRRVFDPTFTLHDIRRTGEWEITYRWTMAMRLFSKAAEKAGPPKLAFTGTSIMGINPSTGKFDRHWDTWDAVKNQEFFSVEAFKHVLSQISDLKKVPSLETPPYLIVKKTAQYEIRQYDAFPVAEAPMQPGAAAAASGATDGQAQQQQGANGGGPGVTAFRELARYIFGGNAAGVKMDMTTPVFTNADRSRMQFVLPHRFQVDENPPAPLPNSQVRTKQQEGGTYAVTSFSGRATSEIAAQQATTLRSAVERDGHKPASGEWLLAQYNDPGTWPIFRRNEVLIPMEDFKLW